MISSAVWKSVATLAAIVTAAWAVDARYENRAEAAARHELLAADRESGELATRLELVKIRIERFTETAKVRPLTEAEQIELRSLEAERAALLSRLAAKG